MAGGTPSAASPTLTGREGTEQLLCPCSTSPGCAEGVAPAHHMQPEVTSPSSCLEAASAAPRPSLPRQELSKPRLFPQLGVASTAKSIICETSSL